MKLEFQQYLQQAITTRSTPNFFNTEVNASSLDRDVEAIHLQLGKYKLTNVSVDGGFSNNVMSHHLLKHLGLPPLRTAKFILRMANN